MFSPRFLPPRASRLLRPRAGPVALAQAQAQRRIHHLPDLGRDFPDGLGDLLSREAMHQSWTEYQQLLLDRLSEKTVGGTSLENRSPLEVLKTTARDARQASTFNYASMAHNNHFFFRTLRPNPISIPQVLKHSLERSFGTIETLRREMLMTASAMFGPGFVWLVQTVRPKQEFGNVSELSRVDTDETPDFGVMATYLAGSPYTEAGWRLQASDMTTARFTDHWRLVLTAALAAAGPRVAREASRAVKAVEAVLRQSEDEKQMEELTMDPFARMEHAIPSENARRPSDTAVDLLQREGVGGAALANEIQKLGDSDSDERVQAWMAGVGDSAPMTSRTNALPLGGMKIKPLMCVNTWEHVWLRDYGIGGKDAFLESWWNHIDWEYVSHEAPPK